MKFAAIIFFDDKETHRWVPVGVVAHNEFGVAKIKMDTDLPIVHNTPALHNMDITMNETLAEGEILWYEGNGIGRVKTSDEYFLEKYSVELEKHKGFIRIGPIMKFTDENIDEHLPRLLAEARGRFNR